jgi:hypothetical protein
MEREIIPEQRTERVCASIDCSSDELVERSLADMLSEKLPDEGKKSLLVADEYHMLSKEHKQELMNWVMPRFSWLKVVLLGNRTDG